MIKALFFDLDGTLLTSSGKMSEKTKSALRICKGKGIQIFIATGRPPLLSKMLNLTTSEEEIIQDVGVFHNGGCASCNNQKIYTTFPEEVVNKIIDIVATYKDINVAVQMIDEKHSFRYELTEGEYGLWGVSKESNISYDNFTRNEVVKIVIFNQLEILKDLHKHLVNEVGSETTLYHNIRGEFKSIDIINIKTNKKIAVDKVVELCGFTSDEIAVFGDDHNDVEMLKGYKNSFAMGNACDEAKNVATYTTLGNNDDGIYFALKNILMII